MHLHGKQLAWVKEACEPGALRHEFQLKLYPMDSGHLPDHLRKQGYFEFSVRGVWFDGKCLGATRLPDFALARIRLWQSGLGRGVAMGSRGASLAFSLLVFRFSLLVFPPCGAAFPRSASFSLLVFRYSCLALSAFGQSCI